MRGGREQSALAGRDLRPLGAAAIVVFLAAAAAGAGALRGTDQPAPERTAWTLPLLISVVGLASIISFVAVGYAYWPSRRWKVEKDERTPWPLWAKLAAIGVILLIMMSAFMFLVAATGTREPPQLPGTNTTSTTLSLNLKEPVPEPTPTKPLRLAWWMAAGSVVLAAAMATGLVLLTKGRRWAEQVPEPAPAASSHMVTQLVDRSIDALAAEADARAAVIAAYESMEHTLAESGTPRMIWETPFEYVDRILMQFGATAETAARLTELFEEAKFSSHEVGPGMKADALDALNTLRLELVAA